MAAIKVHGSPASGCTWRVLFCPHEKGLEYELVNVNFQAGEHKKEPSTSLNPFSQIPVLEHGDLKLFESRTITQYIAHWNQDKGTDLLCKGNRIATLNVWMEVEAQQFEPAASKLNWELIFNPMFGMTTDPAAVEEYEAKIAKVLDVYESRLAQSKYLACDCFTLADLHHLPTITFLLDTRCKKLFDSRPKISAWVADMTSRPAWAKVLALQKQ